MNPREAYNIWAAQYDSDANKTRDLEARSLREIIADMNFQRCLEIGCGTGKNTEWLMTKAHEITSVDFSEEMLAIAREKINSDQVKFIQSDINHTWSLPPQHFDLVTFSLVLEHIENLDHIFKQVAKVIEKGGFVYIGELHPFKQYSGSKARFETEEGLKFVDCYIHHLSDFFSAASRNGFFLCKAEEFFDEDDRNAIPTVLALLFQIR